MLSGCTPKDIALASCHDELLAVGDPWSCTVEAAVVGRPSSLHFDTQSRNRVAKVKLALQVAKGTLRLGYRDLTGDRQASVTPATPMALDFETRMHPDRRSFTLSFEPADGKVEGLSGTVKYSTP